MQQAGKPSVPMNFSPSRFHAAMSILRFCAMKEQEVPSPGEVGGSVPGVDLTKEEKVLQGIACQYLGDYVQGTTIPDPWEQIVLRSMEQSPDRDQKIAMDAQRILLSSLPHHPETRVIPCYFCEKAEEAAKRTCPQCKGVGSVLLVPMPEVMAVPFVVPMEEEEDWEDD
jgi:hypothetical protein